MAIDWSLARGGGNAFAAAMDGYQAGRALAKERGVQNALATYASDPVAGSKELKRFDPKTAMQLDDNRAAQAREATTYAQGQEDRTRKLQEDRLKLAGQMLQGIDTPEKWDAVKGDPQIEALIPGIAASPFEKVNQLRQMGLNLLTKPAEAFTLDNTRFDAQGRVIASVAPEQKYVPVPEGGTLVPVPRGGQPSAPAPVSAAPAAPNAAPAVPMQMLADLTRMGAKITSGVRTPEHNAEVDGVANSYHLASRGGVARDIVPPAGMGLDEFLGVVRQKLPPGWEAINHRGTHVHIEPAPAGAPTGAAGSTAAADMPGAITGAPKRTARPATAAEKATYGLSDDVPAQMRPDGTLDVLTGPGVGVKLVPDKIRSGYSENRQTIAKIDEAIAQVKANPKAFGIVNALGENITQRRDPNGVTPRATVSNIGSLVLHDRSGAAVAASESPRLMPFIPTVTDRSDAVIKKLTAMRREAENANSGIEVEFGPENGYRPLVEPKRAAPAASAPMPAAKPQQQAANSPPLAALKPGQVTTFANGQKWTVANGKPQQVK